MTRIDPGLLDPARYPSALELQTRFGDLDPNDHLNNVAVARLFEEARVRLDTVIPHREPLAGRQVVVAAVHIEFLVEMTYPDPVTVMIGIERIGTTSWTVAELAMQNGRACAFCRATPVCTQAGRPAVLPEALRKAFAPIMMT